MDDYDYDCGDGVCLAAQDSPVAGKLIRLDEAISIMTITLRRQRDCYNLVGGGGRDGRKFLEQEKHSLRYSSSRSSALYHAYKASNPHVCRDSEGVYSIKSIQVFYYVNDVKYSSCIHRGYSDTTSESLNVPRPSAQDPTNSRPAIAIQSPTSDVYQRTGIMISSTNMHSDAGSVSKLRATVPTHSLVGL